MSRLGFMFLELNKKIWPKVTAYALLGVISALIAAVLKSYIPEDLSDVVGAETVGNILTILASSMLAVTTFSLSTMVAAYGAATANVTPRATKLITEDKVTQNALSTFLGSFLFSLVGIIALNMGIYEGGGRFVLFGFTLGIIVLIVVMFIRWIDRLTTLGRVNETNALIEKAALEAIRQRACKPTFGCSRLEVVPAGYPPENILISETSGYIQHFDTKKLSTLAEQYDVDIFVLSMPGKLVESGTALAVLSRNIPEKHEEFLACFTISEQRTFEQDPRFGLCVLTEVGCRAMSSAINDHGTAIDVVIRLGRVLSVYAAERKQEDAEYKRVWVPELCAADLFQDAFNPLVRDAAGSYEVQVRLQKTFVQLGKLGAEYRAASRKYSAIALRYSDDRLFLEEEKTELRRLAHELDEECPPLT